MKKIALFLALVLVGSAAMAAAPAATAEKPSGMRVGVESVFIQGVGTIGLPYIGFKLNDNQTVDVGLTYWSLNDGATTDLALVGRFENKITEIGKVKLNWSGTLGIISDNAGATTTILALIGAVGAEYKIADALSIYGNIDLINFQNTSGGGASSTSYFLLNGNGNAYSGMRVYI